MHRSIGYFEETQAVLFSGIAWAGLGYGYYLLGELEASQKHIGKGLEIHKNGSIPSWLCMYFLNLGIVHFDTGDLKKALNCVEEAVRLSEKNGERHWEACSRIWLGRILKKAGRSVARSEEHISYGIKISHELRLKPFIAQGDFFLGELYADNDQKEKALETLKKAEREFQEMGMDYWLVKTQEVLSRL